MLEQRNTGVAQHSASIANHIYQIAHAAHDVCADFALQAAGNGGEVEINARGVNAQLDLIQIRFELCLYHQCAIHRFFDRVIALLQQWLSTREQCDGDGGGACRYGIEGAAVEVFEDVELVLPCQIGGTAGGGPLDVHRQCMPGIRSSEGGAHGAGVRPFLEDVVEQGSAVSAGGGLGELGNKGCQRAVAADGFAQATHLAAAVHVGQSEGLGGER